MRARQKTGGAEPAPPRARGGAAAAALFFPHARLAQCSHLAVSTALVLMHRPSLVLCGVLAAVSADPRLNDTGSPWIASFGYLWLWMPAVWRKLTTLGTNSSGSAHPSRVDPPPPRDPIPDLVMPRFRIMSFDSKTKVGKSRSLDSQSESHHCLPEDAGRRTAQDGGRWTVDVLDDGGADRDLDNTAFCFELTVASRTHHASARR